MKTLQGAIKEILMEYILEGVTLGEWKVVSIWSTTKCVKPYEVQLGCKNYLEEWISRYWGRRDYILMEEIFML